jgi:hypothetical protein
MMEDLKERAKKILQKMNVDSKRAEVRDLELQSGKPEQIELVSTHVL